MNAPQRYTPAERAGTLIPSESGSAVLFADVEEALRDSGRFRWVMPLIDGTNLDEHGGRARALFEVYNSTKLRGIPLIDEAMRRCPA